MDEKQPEVSDWTFTPGPSLGPVRVFRAERLTGQQGTIEGVYEPVVDAVRDAIVNPNTSIVVYVNGRRRGAC